MFVPDGPGGNLKKVTAVCWGTNHEYDETGALVREDFVCPVRAECEEFGVANNEIGVWGGKVRSSRDHLRVTKNGHHGPDVEDTIKVYVKLKDSRPSRETQHPT